VAVSAVMSADIGCLFLLASNIWLFLVGRQDGSPSDQPADGGVQPLSLPTADLMRIENPMN
jgi:hypothetical protein